MKKKTVFAFDWDNTLIDSHHKGLRCMCKALAENGFFYDEKSINEIYCPDYHEIFNKIKIPSQQWPRLDKLWLKYYKNEESLELFPEVIGVLTELSGKGKIITLITTGQRLRVNGELEFLNIKQLFNYIVCREDVTNVKPAPDAIELIKKKYQNSDLIYIGDHDHDVQMAKNAGVKWYKIDRNNNTSLSKEQHIINNLRLLVAELR